MPGCFRDVPGSAYLHSVGVKGSRTEGGLGLPFLWRYQRLQHGARKG